MEKALLDGRGDLFVSASLLGITVVVLDRVIRASPQLQDLYQTIEQVAVLEQYDRTTMARFAAEVSRRRTLYQSDALDALHDLATMPVSGHPATLQAKFLAASRLAGPAEERTSAAVDLDQTLSALNDEYHKAAPRIREIRERVITFDEPEKVIPQ